MQSAEWYLVYTKPRQERSAQQNLDRQGYSTYLPITQSRRNLQGRWRQVIEPLFPRYVFIQLSRTQDNWGPIRSTYGVSCIVRFGITAARVPDDFVHGLQGSADENGMVLGMSQEWHTGDRVRIVDGPLGGYEAVFVGRCGHERVRVLLDVIGQFSAVELGEQQLASV